MPQPSPDPAAARRRPSQSRTERGCTLLGAMQPTHVSGLSRRTFLGAAAAVPFLAGFTRLAATERKRVKIRDLQTMTMQGASRTYVLVRIVSDDGLFGIGEA